SPNDARCGFAAPARRFSLGAEAAACQEFRMLTRSQIAQYRYDGYLFPFPALSPEELAGCNAGLARYEAWLGKPVNQADRRWRSAAYVMLPWYDRLVRHP